MASCVVSTDGLHKTIGIKQQSSSL